MYFFECTRRGKCVLEAKTSGKNGFAAPKLFVLKASGAAWRGTLTLTHIDRTVESVERRDENSKADFLRIAIGQFIRWEERESGDFKGTLDLTCPPFVGDIINRRGSLISEKSFLPKQRIART